MRAVAAIICIILLQGCIGGMGFAVEKGIIGNYYLVAVDAIDQSSISIRDSSNSFTQVIDAAVFAYGFNEDFLMVKQHPVDAGGVNKAKTQYYIIVLNHKQVYSGKGDRIGPLTEASFNKARTALKIPDSMAFTHVEKRLE